MAKRKLNRASEDPAECEKPSAFDRELAFKVLELFVPYKLKYSAVRRILRLTDALLTLSAAIEAVDQIENEGRKPRG